MSDLIKRLQKTDRCYCGSQVVDGELKLVGCLFHNAADALEQWKKQYQDTHAEVGILNDETRELRRRIEQLEAALREIRDEIGDVDGTMTAWLIIGKALETAPPEGEQGE